ncbi:MAG: hypothetical protein HC830_11165 [Bacteroidetes bacterium]|nr:hypothetical protein [Bacteroidota bacterium]
MDSFPEKVENAFQNVRLSYRTELLQMRMTGLNVFGSCVALLGVFDKEEDYDTVISFRKQFYGNPVMQQSGICWTRPFIGHITLAYLGRELNHTERLMLESAVNEVNVAFDLSEAVFNINQTELRSYTDLSCFNTTSSYPVFSFLK